MLLFRKSPLLTRLLLLTASSILLGYFLLGSHQWFAALIMGGVVFIQIKWLTDILHSPASVPDAALFQKISFDEDSEKFTATSDDPAASVVIHHLNGALRQIRTNRNEREAEYIFLKNIVMHAGIGLIIFRSSDGKIEIFNVAARKLLRLNRAENIADLKQISETLHEAFFRLKTGGSELLRLTLGDDFIQLSIYAIELTLRGENLKFISLQNIRNELEEKEMEAWQNLVRVLTHEIMNSVTPISSLASSLEQDLTAYATRSRLLSEEELTDMQLALQTISRRSANLIHFVREFRSLTHIPKPKPETLEVKTLLEEVHALLKKELTEKQITCTVEVEPPDLTLQADKSQIEQVLINLMKNAIQAFDENQSSRRIILSGYYNDRQRPIISVADNGPGIEPEAMEKIFIPFFTTKKSGSGIGLSLSRQIMRQHQGSLSVRSAPGQGAVFLLRF